MLYGVFTNILLSVLSVLIDKTAQWCDAKPSEAMINAMGGHYIHSGKGYFLLKDERSKAVSISYYLNASDYDNKHTPNMSWTNRANVLTLKALCNVRYVSLTSGLLHLVPYIWSRTSGLFHAMPVGGQSCWLSTIRAMSNARFARSCALRSKTWKATSNAILDVKRRRKEPWVH